MKLKRRIFGLFMTVFTLCGCTSSVAYYSDTITLKQPNTIENMQTLKVVKETVKTVSAEMPEMVYAEYDGGEGIPWIASYVEGSSEMSSEEFFVTYDEFGNVISKTAVLGSKIETAAVAPKMQFGGTVSVGSEFYPYITTYGIDCDGCYINPEGNGSTSVGVTVNKDAVLQPNGEMKDGITYAGYYIVAADPSIPLCSIVTISNHGYSGEGLSEGVPFKAIVLDRGGAIVGSRLDLFKGSEVEHEIAVNRSYSNIKVVIERVGGKIGRACAV